MAPVGLTLLSPPTAVLKHQTQGQRSPLSSVLVLGFVTSHSPLLLLRDVPYNSVLYENSQRIPQDEKPPRRLAQLGGKLGRKETLSPPELSPANEAHPRAPAGSERGQRSALER